MAGVTTSSPFGISGDTVERQFVTLGARQVHLRRSGRGPAAVLLAPLPYSSELFEPLVVRLSKRFTVLAPDLAGYGDTAPLPKASPRVEDYARDVLNLLDAVGVSRFALYGVQFGAVVALSVAAEAAGRVTSLVVRDVPLLTASEREAFAEAYARPIAPRIDGGHLLEHFRLRRDEHVFFPPSAADPARALRFDLQRPGVLAARLQRGVVDQMRALPDHTPGYAAMLASDSEAAIGLIRAPLTVLCTPDDLLPPAAGRLDPAIPHVSFEENDDEAAALERLLQPDGADVPPTAATTPVPGAGWRTYAATPAGQVLVRRAGPDGGVPLVLFHAAPGSGRRLESLLRALAPDRPCYALDTLGVGGSARPAILYPPQIADYALATCAALDDLGLEMVDLYGTHTGSLVALETAILLGDRARSVVLNGVPLFSEAERAVFLEHHFVDLEPRWDGAEPRDGLGARPRPAPLVPLVRPPSRALRTPRAGRPGIAAGVRARPAGRRSVIRRPVSGGLPARDP